MAIQSTTGDLLKQHDVDAIVNTVNCVGVMGKGIALQFKKKWPANFKAYSAACKAGQVKLGQMFIFDLGALATPRYIVNFPTKGDWRSASKLSDIETGLLDLVEQVKAWDIQSLAMPPLGCGNGGLNWQSVKPLIEQNFAPLTDVTLKLFEPSEAAVPVQLEVNTPAPKMTAGRAAISPNKTALEQAKQFIANADNKLNDRVERVATLINGFQSPFGMELLASVHWVAKQEGATSAEQALEKIQSWNPRKKQLMKSHHVASAWLQLKQHQWI